MTLTLILKTNNYYQLRQGNPGNDLDILDNATEKEVIQFLFEYFQGKQISIRLKVR